MVDTGAFQNRVVDVDREHITDDETRSPHLSQLDNAHDPAFEIGRRLRHQWSRHVTAGHRRETGDGELVRVG